MSDYMMLPGARLEIGPGGKPYETLGAVPVAPCCSACAKGGSRCGALGDSAVFDLVTNPIVLVVGGLFIWWKFFGGSESRAGKGYRTVRGRAKGMYRVAKGH